MCVLELSRHVWLHSSSFPRHWRSWLQSALKRRARKRPSSSFTASSQAKSLLTWASRWGFDNHKHIFCYKPTHIVTQESIWSLFPLCVCVSRKWWRREPWTVWQTAVNTPAPIRSVLTSQERGKANPEGRKSPILAATWAHTRARALTTAKWKKDNDSDYPDSCIIVYYRHWISAS